MSTTSPLFRYVSQFFLKSTLIRHCEASYIDGHHSTTVQVCVSVSLHIISDLTACETLYIWSSDYHCFRCTSCFPHIKPDWKLMQMASTFLLFSHDRPIEHGYPNGCQHRFANPAEAKALTREGASALV